MSDSILQASSDSITAKVSVTNTGIRAGKEAVLWFIFDEVATLSRPVRDLKYFEKQPIDAGQSFEFSFTIRPTRDLWFPDKNGTHRLEDGYFTLMVGDQKARFKLMRE